MENLEMIRMYNSKQINLTKNRTTAYIYPGHPLAIPLSVYSEIDALPEGQRLKAMQTYIEGHYSPKNLKLNSKFVMAGVGTFWGATTENIGKNVAGKLLTQFAVCPVKPDEPVIPDNPKSEWLLTGKLQHVIDQKSVDKSIDVVVLTETNNFECKKSKNIIYLQLPGIPNKHDLYFKSLIDTMILALNKGKKIAIIGNRQFAREITDNYSPAIEPSIDSDADAEDVEEEDSDVEEEEAENGNVRIGTKRPRGVEGATNPVFPNFKNIDVTSGSANKLDGRQVKLDFSPMLLGPVKIGGKVVAKNFENFWQYGKVFKELNHISDTGKLTSKWQTFRKNGYAQGKADRHPKGTKSNKVAFVDKKGHNHYQYYKPIYAVYDVGDGDKKFDYIAARKKVYAPLYAELVRKTPSFKSLKKMIANGQAVQILDIDGPRDKNSHVVTVNLLKKKINDPSAPFGHGYVLAGLLAGIEPSEYV